MDKINKSNTFLYKKKKLLEQELIIQRKNLKKYKESLPINIDKFNINVLQNNIIVLNKQKAKLEIAVNSLQELKKKQKKLRRICNKIHTANYKLQICWEYNNGGIKKIKEYKKNIAEILKKIYSINELIRSQKSQYIRITTHAWERYCERIGKISFNEFKTKLLNNYVKYVVLTVDKGIVVNNNLKIKAVFEDRNIITVYPD